jgi:ribosomal protein L7/L12
LFNAIDLAYRIGTNLDPKLAERLVMEMLRTTPEVVLESYRALTVGVNSNKFPQVPQETIGTVVTLLRCDNKVVAVKEVRAAMGLGLKEALDVVNGLQQELAERI